MKIRVNGVIGELVSMQSNVVEASTLGHKAFIAMTYNVTIYNTENGKGRYL